MKQINVGLQIAIAASVGAIIGGAVPFSFGMTPWVVLLGITIGALAGWVLFDPREASTTLKAFLLSRPNLIWRFATGCLVAIGIISLFFVGILVVLFSLFGTIFAFFSSVDFWIGEIGNIQSFQSQVIMIEFGAWSMVFNFMAPLTLTVLLVFQDGMKEAKRTLSWSLDRKGVLLPVFASPPLFPVGFIIICGVVMCIVFQVMVALWKTFWYLHSEPRLFSAVSAAIGVLVGIVAGHLLVCGITGFVIGILGHKVASVVADKWPKVVPAGMR